MRRIRFRDMRQEGPAGSFIGYLSQVEDFADGLIWVLGFGSGNDGE